MLRQHVGTFKSSHGGVRIRDVSNCVELLLLLFNFVWWTRLCVRISVFHSWWQWTRRMGQSRWIDDNQIRKKKKWTPSFPSHESFVPRSVQKQKRGENYRYDCVPMEIRLILFFRTIISVNQRSIYGAVSYLLDEYRTCHIRTGRPVLKSQSDQLFTSVSLLMTISNPSTEDAAPENVLQK